MVDRESKFARFLSCSALMVLALYATPSRAEYYSANAIIERLTAYSSNRPANLITQDLVSVELVSDVFSGTPCAGGIVNIAKQDVRIYASAMAAIMQKAPVQIAVESELKVNNACQITVIKLMR